MILNLECEASKRPWKKIAQFLGQTCLQLYTITADCYCFIIFSGKEYTWVADLGLALLECSPGGLSA